MKRILIILVVFLLSIPFCNGQNLIEYKGLTYTGYSYHNTSNNSFVNKRILFLKNSDTIVFNLKIPFDRETKNIFDPGIFYNCKLTQDSIYSFEIEKSTLAEIPKEFNSYYKANCVFNSREPSKFREIKKNTKYIYASTGGMFIDIGHRLYKIVKMTPAGNCTMQL